jgi:hypothetical protein
MIYRISTVIFCFFLLTSTIVFSQDNIFSKLDKPRYAHFKRTNQINPNNISEHTILNNDYQKSHEYWLWDKSVNKIPGIEYKIMMDKKQYFIDEQICSREIISNSSGKGICFSVITEMRPGYFPVNAIKVQYVTSSNKKINTSLTSFGMKIYEKKHQDYKELLKGTYMFNYYSSLGPKLIPDQKKWIAQWGDVPLNTLFNMTLPGKYEITFGRVLFADNDNKGDIFLASNTITIEILQKKYVNGNNKLPTYNSNSIVDIGTLENTINLKEE